jgi:hypothetical protein
MLQTVGQVLGLRATGEAQVLNLFQVRGAVRGAVDKHLE